MDNPQPTAPFANVYAGAAAIVYEDGALWSVDGKSLIKTDLWLLQEGGIVEGSDEVVWVSQGPADDIVDSNGVRWVVAVKRVIQ